ncbi:glycosyltransferase [Campylobacter sp. RM9328]|uniref:glycosyltransferase family 2 protein n=1 Tax=Campylobacter sp. RM9328 TaxID=1705720 RepID=UPI001473E577|nr:glycosyltransferase [Campylobacter sp. RM9328]
MKISVIMPVYNAEKYLDEAIQSILNQTYKDCEFIIINDGSTDDSLSIIERYKKQDERIVLIDRENRGIVASLNEGIQIAKGKYIARMDADDISLPTRFEEQLKIMENDKNIVVCGSWVNIFGENRKDKVFKYFEQDKEIKANLIMSCCFAHPSVIMRKSVFVDNNIWYDENFKNAEDYHLWTQLAKVGKFYNIPRVLLNYRFLETSITRVADKNESQRKEVYTNIFNEALNLINYKRTEEEIELSFIISHKDRIKANKIDLNKLKVYFDKIVQSNNRNNFADSFTLYKMLGNRWLLNFIINKNIKSIFSKYFLYGVISVIK